MPVIYRPAPEDVKTYQRLRRTLFTMNQRLVATIPAQAYTEIGEALGILRDGVVHLESEDVGTAVADCCLYDWYHKGRNLIERYAARHSATARPDERLLLSACCNARYTILSVESLLPDAGLYCRDILVDESLFLMDVSASHTLAPGFSLATRILPLNGYWISSGASLPVTSMKFLDELQSSIGQPLALGIVRACLKAGAVQQVRYALPVTTPRADPAPGEPCPCGSRFKFKFCCGSSR